MHEVLSQFDTAALTPLAVARILGTRIVTVFLPHATVLLVACS